MHHRKEPRHRYSNSNDRPDIVAFDPDKGCNVDLDIALAHPWSSDIFPRSSESDGAAAEKREERKKAKYATLGKSTRWINSQFHSLSYRTFWTMG